MTDDSAAWPAKDPWQPDDPEKPPAAAAVLAYWRAANESPRAQQHLRSDPQRLWRLARDLADALGACSGEEVWP